jgi:hypothetical protein
VPGFTGEKLGCLFIIHPINYQVFLSSLRSHQRFGGIVNSSASRTDKEEEAAEVTEGEAPVIDQSRY